MKKGEIEAEANYELALGTSGGLKGLSGHSWDIE